MCWPAVTCLRCGCNLVDLGLKRSKIECWHNCNARGDAGFRKVALAFVIFDFVGFGFAAFFALDVIAVAFSSGCVPKAAAKSAVVCVVKK